MIEGTPSIVDVIIAAIRADRQDLHVAKPGIVQAYDPDTERATIQIAVKHRRDPDEDGAIEHVSYPLLASVPIVQARCADYGLTFPVKEGDRCMVYFADVNLAEWYAAGEDAESGDVEIHGLAGAFAVLGGAPKGEAWPTPHATAAEFGHRTGPRVRATTARIELGGAAGQAPLVKVAELTTALANLVAYVTAIPGAGVVPPVVTIVGTTEVTGK